MGSDIHHVYLNAETGEWGNRGALVILSLTDAELSAFAKVDALQRVTTWGGATRYFGETYPDAIRRHLAAIDKPTSETEGGE